MAFKHQVSGTGTLTAEKQKWLLNSVKSGKLTFGQAVDAMNGSSKTMDNKLPAHIPQLSNEMQLSIMNKVKSGELTIEDALNQARRKTAEQQRTEEENSSQYNFSVYKYNRYRWQKRILQIDFNTNMVCSIEKGIIKRQLPFSSVKSCDDGVGSKFSISFRGRHDYELEAASLEDKQKIMQLIHKIIYGNIYEVPEPASSEACDQTPVNRSIRQGQLYLQRGGLASFRWVKYGCEPVPLSPFPSLPSASVRFILWSCDATRSDELNRALFAQTDPKWRTEPHPNSRQPGRRCSI